MSSSQIQFEIEFSFLFWWLDAGVTPVLIPNTEVKPCSADDTLTGKVGSRQNRVLNFLTKFSIFCYNALMSSWSAKRKFTYGAVFILIVGLISFGIAYKLFFSGPPKCVCGGTCPNMCPSDVLSPVVLWAKTFNISGNIYTAAAYVENPNVNGRNDSVGYRFSIFDQNNNLITTIDGEMKLPRNKSVAVFANGLVFNNALPARTELDLTSFGPWLADTTPEPQLAVSNSGLLSTSSPRIEGTISNPTLQDFSQVELTAFILDNNQNVIGAGRTVIDNLQSGGEQNFVFTWPNPFAGAPAVVNVQYRILN